MDVWSRSELSCPNVFSPQNPNGIWFQEEGYITIFARCPIIFECFLHFPYSGGSNLCFPNWEHLDKAFFGNFLISACLWGVGILANTRFCSLSMENELSIYINEINFFYLILLLEILIRICSLSKVCSWKKKLNFQLHIIT